MSKHVYLVIMMGSFFFSWKSWALECQWWQSKVKASTIPQHPREGHTVSKHPRREHCRERWKGADHYINQFKDDPVQGWGNKGEIFKKWARSEIQTVLELLPELPQWTKIELYTFRRADKSIHKGNVATSELTKKTIILYDKFFTYEDKLGTIGHEASHFLFPSLSPEDLTEFSDLSGWDVEVKNDKIYVLPPKKPLQADSVINKEEDFTNYMELYISNPNRLKHQNPKMFEFLLKRYPR
jgi:hypothetical protein